MPKKYNPYINWKEINGVTCLYFKFDEKLSESSAKKGGARWNDLIQQRKNENVNGGKYIMCGIAFL